jgi:hypothetical protein
VRTIATKDYAILRSAVLDSNRCRIKRCEGVVGNREFGRACGISRAFDFSKVLEESNRHYYHITTPVTEVLRESVLYWVYVYV